MNDKQIDEPQVLSADNNNVRYPFHKTASFVSRSISSGKRRTYEMEAVATGTDSATFTFNGSTIHLTKETLGIVSSLLSDLSGSMGVSDRIHNGVSRKGVSGDPEFNPNQIAESDVYGLNARTEGQNDEVNGVEAKIRSETRSLQVADGLDTSLVADADAKAVKLAEDQTSKLEDQQAQTESRVKSREAEAKRINKK